MTIYQVAPTIVLFLIFFIGLFVFLHNKSSNVNIIFSLFCLSLCIWLLGYIAMYCSSDPKQALEFARLGTFGYTFLPVLAYHFIATYLQKTPAKWIIILLYLTTIPMLIISRTPFGDSGINTHFWGFYPTPGQFYIIFPLSFIFLFGYGIIILIQELFKQIKSKETIKAKQTKYVLLAFAFGSTGLIDYFIKYGIEVYPFGYISALLFISIIAYAITKTQLMDIRIVINRVMAYLFLTALYVISGIALTFLYHHFFVFGPNLSTFIFLSAVLLIAGLFFHPLRLHLQTTPDKFLFRKKYLYDQAIKELAEISTRNLKKDEVIKIFSSKAKEVFKTKKAEVFLLDCKGDYQKI